MHSFRRTLIRGVALAGLVAAWLAFAGTASAAPPKPAVAKAPAGQPQADYAGQDTCLGCHEDKSARQQVWPARPGVQSEDARRDPWLRELPWAGQGPRRGRRGQDEDRRLSSSCAQEASEMCTSCHDRKTHAFWAGSQHDDRNVGCTSCHSVHAPKGEKPAEGRGRDRALRQLPPSIVNKLNRFNHMPVREDKMICSSCHNVHGSSNVKLLKAGTTVDESCTSCHAEKRGPYLWEHAPVADTCVTCHDPHGSNNDRMLVAKQPFLCQRCHVTSRHPPTVYDGFLLKNSQNANKITAGPAWSATSRSTGPIHPMARRSYAKGGGLRCATE